MKKKLESIAHFSSSLPKRCGIATYSTALEKTIKNRLNELKEFVVAIDDNNKGYRYPSIVKYHFWDQDQKAYKKAADLINQSDAQLVDIQHEFGLYGARVKLETLGKDDGKNFLIFLKNLKKPSVTTMHMVYKNPPKHHMEIVQDICKNTKKIVVLAQIAKDMLIKKYKISSDKIVVIPHGAPNIPKYSTPFYKESLGFPSDSIIISSFGLIRPKKGYEYLIDAMSEIVKKYPTAILLIIGKHHPQRSPEYSAMLKQKVKDLKLKNNVKFINKFVDYSDLLNYLMATNIFVTPFLVMDQVSSGTLIYAMACGKVCISTPYDYAKEALADKRGMLVPPMNSHKIATKVDYLIRHPKVRHRIEKDAYKYARKQIWSKIARSYVRLFESVINDKSK